MAQGRFHNVLDETDDLDKSQVRKVVLCSGKVYYHLRAARREREINNIAILRMEQIYPYPEAELTQILSQYPKLQDAAWCQEEPMNQGAWYSSQHHTRRVFHNHNPDIYLSYVGREASAAPAAGYMALHLAQQNKFIDDALALD